MGNGRRESKSEYDWSLCEGRRSSGIVVGVLWMLGNLKNFQRHVRLYNSCDWDSLSCYPPLYNLWFPIAATSFAVRMLDVLVEEVEKRPRPIVFAMFSGGAKACVYKMFQILMGVCEGVDSEKYAIVRECFVGQIHDSSPVDFVAESGIKFFNSTAFRKTEKPPSFIVTKIVETSGKVVDFMFHTRFSTQREELWATLYKTSEMGPVLILCSKDDDLARFDIVKQFSDGMVQRGCQVTFISWEKSSHVGHLRDHHEEYTAAVDCFLAEAASSFAHRKEKLPKKYFLDRQPIMSKL